MIHLEVRSAGVDDAAAICAVIHAACEPRQTVEPLDGALSETAESVAESLARTGGLICSVGGVSVGALLFAERGSALSLHRVSVIPRVRCRGIGSAMVGAAEGVAGARGYDEVGVVAGPELATTLTFWVRRGYSEVTTDACIGLGKALPAEVHAVTADDTRALGRRLAGVTRAGDLIILAGDLGAGKTTLAQGIGAGLEVRGDVTSPTFVISRVHPSLVGRPALVHVDAYRLGESAELDGLDLDALADESVTVVEWGDGIAETLAPDRLRVHLARRRGGTCDDVDDTRVITVTPVGARWFGTGVRTLVTGSAPRSA